ncbi:hypothetical protein NEOLEDRAFT_1135595 [Neolentinus lepideus HHB14362 ss-1]|uniref:Uncharacterized protein n=1 Tax=Neolentinus lepideus HHB14362 ss-1 TaxID=1314782 RepID=A0A165RN62_9AGAM|nr:hypothetical protein NEOLEDRAFT_1135595 [Neolentinus lepideus HHB14362 ss-1]
MRKACKVCGRKKCKNWTHKASKSKQDTLPPCELRNPPNVYRIVYVTGILLPADEDAPRLVKVKCEVKLDDEYPHSLIHHFDLTPFIGGTYAGHSFIHSVAGSILQNPFLALYRDGFLADGSPINRSIRRLTRDRALHPWAGNVLVMKCNSNSPSDGKYIDASMEDLPIIQAYFVEYGQRLYETVRLYGSRRPSRMAETGMVGNEASGTVLTLGLLAFLLLVFGCYSRIIA